MTLPSGVFTAFGILAYLILWRYIFLQFFKLLKQSEDHQDFHREAELESFDENGQAPCEIVANISPPVQSMVLYFEPFSIFTLRIQPKRDVIQSNSLLLHKFYRQNYSKNPSLDEVEHFNKIHGASNNKFSEFLLRSGIGRSKKSILAEKDKSIMLKFKDMEFADNTTGNTKKPGNCIFRDIDGSFGTSEVVECLATPPNIKPNVQFGREEKDLNRMIRRLVAAELIKCCEKEHAAMSRTHSDTNNRVNWKRNKYNKQAVNFQANLSLIDKSQQKSKQSVCNSGGPESFLTFSVLPIKHDINDDVLDKRINSDSEQKFVAKNVGEGSQNGDLRNDDEDKGSVDSVVIVDDHVSISCRGGVHQINNPSESETAGCIEEPEAEMIRTARMDTILQANVLREMFEDATTQTEHMYMIRAVRSCPGRKRRLQLLATPREMTKVRSGGKDVQVEISLPIFLYRKASDNLIYEKGKGSRSPSYVPVPERFRWRYVMPSKVN